MIFGAASSREQGTRREYDPRSRRCSAGACILVTHCTDQIPFDFYPHYSTASVAVLLAHTSSNNALVCTKISCRGLQLL